MSKKPQGEVIDIVVLASGLAEKTMSKRYTFLRIGRYSFSASFGWILSNSFTVFYLCLAISVVFAVGLILGWFDSVPPSTPTPQPSSIVTPTLQDLAELDVRLADLEQEIAALNTTAQSRQIDDLQQELQEIRSAIFGDPEKVLVLQRMELEMVTIGRRMDALDIQTKWIFRVTLMLALAVLATVLATIVRAFLGPKPYVVVASSEPDGS